MAADSASSGRTTDDIRDGAGPLDRIAWGEKCDEGVASETGSVALSLDWMVRGAVALTREAPTDTLAVLSTEAAVPTPNRDMVPR